MFLPARSAAHSLRYTRALERLHTTSAIGHLLDVSPSYHSVAEASKSTIWRSPWLANILSIEMTLITHSQTTKDLQNCDHSS